MRGIAYRLSDGFDTHERKDGTVVRLHAGGRLVGEIVIGEETVRVNFKEEFAPEVDLVAQAEGVAIAGRSKSWAGGIRVDDANIDAVRQVLNAVREDAVLLTERLRSVRESIAVLEEAARNGILDEHFEQELKKLLDRRLEAPARRRRASRSRAVAA